MMSRSPEGFLDPTVSKNNVTNYPPCISARAKPWVAADTAHAQVLTSNEKQKNRALHNYIVQFPTLESPSASIAEVVRAGVSCGSR